MTTDDENLARETEQLLEMLDGLDAAVEERDAAKLRVTATARAIGDKLNRIGHFARIADQPFDREIARRLYWEYPDVHVREIAHPLNIREGLVAREMGTGVVEKACAADCGRTVVWNLSSRSDAARQSRLCDECAAAVETARNERWARARMSMASEHDEEIELLRDHVEANRAPYARYAEFPGVPGTWAVDENGIPLALKD